MSKYRNRLPQLDGGLFLTDSGLETTLVFHENFELPHFAAFDLLRDQKGAAVLRDYYRTHAALAAKAGIGFVLETPTWRASADWGEKLGYGSDALDAVNREAIALMEDVRHEFESADTPMVISGQMGPRGDGYDPGDIMTPEEAQAYHGTQIATFVGTAADMVNAMTITNTPAAIGITRAARAGDMPLVIGFTVETDGHLPTGQPLNDAIEEVDSTTDGGPAYYIVNCAHPTHFQDRLDHTGGWVQRIRGLRCNASSCSHAELDEAEELDSGDPVQLAAEYRAIVDRLPHINVFGGCCGTDHRHVQQISATFCEAA